MSRSLPPRRVGKIYLSSTWLTRCYIGVVLTIAGLVATPVLVVLSHIFGASAAAWQHLAQTVLLGYVLNSLQLILGVGFGTAVLGIGTAWCVTLCRFPGRHIFEWALLLPLAVPAYVLAYTYTDFLDVAGPVQTLLRDRLSLSVQQYWFPEIRSVGGAIAMLTLALYPYLYMLAKVAFLEQARNTLEASRALGSSPWRSFWAIALPLARPSIIAGLSLVLMETLSDFGTVQYFSVDTFTTGIYRTWSGMGDPATATQLSAVLLLGILGLIVLEQWSRGHARYYQNGSQHSEPLYFVLRGVKAWLAVLLCALPLTLGFLLPVTLLSMMAFRYASANLTPDFWGFAANSLTLSLSAGAITVVLAITLAYSLRLYPTKLLRTAGRVAAMGYAIPGSVIAVGISIPLGWVANMVNRTSLSLWGTQAGWVLSGTVGALIFAYVVRFLAVSFNTVEASLSKIKPTLDDASRSLGCSPTATLTKVHVPLMWSGLLTAMVLCFVDIMKELPATLMIRPFNFDTLAVRVYRLASDERLAEAAGPSLAIVVVGLIPVLLLSLRITRGRDRPTAESATPYSHRPKTAL
ncbi:MAG: iron ABC transporter permease [Thermosynechococcaceae cyanobacterium MS004]|nr:iron ABC transporter permease [Thermosynechococcaceae cyanobacterium MS004]